MHHPNEATPRRRRRHCLGMLRNLYRLLALPSAHTIYYHRTRARVINYWHQGRQRATSVPPDQPTTPGEKTRKIGPEQPEDAMWFPLVFAQSQAVFLRNVTNGSYTTTSRAN
jgi:hypothetical protein